ncbi:MAG: glycosyltransferase [Leptospiraceae bacterium]|nr:glycosyltransferase [Leptospiraceae bacterium]
MKRAAVVIVTYNNPAFLGICLAAYKNQSYKNFAIFIADDGSRSETKAKIDAYRKILPQPIVHFWHPDVGYRKAQIVNHVWRSLDSAEFPVIINVDHDTVAHRRFVEDHVLQFENSDNLLFMGRRVNLGPQVTQTYCEENVTEKNQGFPWHLFRAARQNDVEDPNRGIRIGPAWLRKLLGRDRVPDLLGSNFSISNTLLRKINGYNEEYKHYWGEDGDLFVRARNSGAEIRGSRAIAIQHHLYHKMLRPDAAAMENYYKVLLPGRDYKFCAQGITGSKEKVQDVMVFKNN